MLSVSGQRMPWRPVWLIRLSCAMLALGGCAAPAPYTDYDPAVDFSHFKSYAWIQADPLIVPADGSVVVSALDRQRITDAIDAELARRGFVHGDPARADFVVSYNVGARDRIDVFS